MKETQEAGGHGSWKGDGRTTEGRRAASRHPIEERTRFAHPSPALVARLAARVSVLSTLYISVPSAGGVVALRPSLLR